MISELQIPLSSYEDAVGHLFSILDSECAAFLFAHESRSEGHIILSVADCYLVPRSGFVRSSAFHFELNHDVQANIIKEAHNRGCCLVEAHSHPFPAVARFSSTDVSGLLEWVPHVRWRLKGRPYVALVLAPGSFDALVFSD